MEKAQQIAAIAAQLLAASIQAGKTKLDGVYLEHDTEKAIDIARKIIQKSNENEINK